MDKKYDEAKIKKKINEEIISRKIDLSDPMSISEIVKISLEFNTMLDIDDNIKNFLLEKVDEQNTVFDIIINNIHRIYKIKDVFFKLNNKLVTESNDFPLNLLLAPINGVSFFEFILQLPQIKNKRIDPKLLYDKNILMILLRNNRIKDLLYAPSDILLTNFENEKKLFDLILEKYDNLNFPLGFINKDVNLVKILIKHKYFNYLIRQENLLQTYETTSVIDLLLNDKDFLNSVEIGKLEEMAKNDIFIARKFLENNQPLFLIDVTNEVLYANYNDDIFLNAIIDKIIEIASNPNNKKMVVRQKYSKEFLLHRTKSKYTFLEFLLSVDKEETLKRLLAFNLDNDVEILTILKLNNIDIKQIDSNSGELSFEFTNITKLEQNEYSSLFYKKYYEGDIDFDQKLLIEQVRTLFIQDGQSDIEVIDLLCNSFKYLFIKKDIYAKRDIEMLINIKKDNPKFALKKGMEQCFSPRRNMIIIKNIYDIDVFNHELTHALHYFYNRYNYPENLELTKFTICNDKYNSIIEKFKQDHIRIFNSLQLNYDEYQTNNLELEKYQNAYNKIIEYSEKEKLYPKHDIDNVKKQFNIASEYEKKRRIFIKRMVMLEIYNCNFNFFKSIISIIDILNNSELGDNGIIVDEYFLISDFTHDSNYYNNSLRIKFMEILAEYVQILKSPQAKEGIKILISLVGNEFIEMLDDFYNGFTYDENRKKQI